MSLPRKLDDYKHEPPPTFKPTWILDTSDMSVVPGSEICEPYYTLSYSWNQSGDYFKNEHDDGYTRIDRGQHIIVLDLASLDRNETPRRRVRYVKFEQLVQEICKNFGVKYLWWDQYCINQSNKEEKRREIKQMHKIYENACRTIVLVPELHQKPYDSILGLLENSQWFKRVWTLVEGFKSRKLLFVGENVHLHSDIIPKLRDRVGGTENNLVKTICSTAKEWSAGLALSHANKRATTKKHDYYFAFANMFPEKLSDLNFSYDQDIQELALDFYQRLAQNDPTILFFGAFHTAKYENVMLDAGQENNPLPSWTGIHGVHYERAFGVGKFNPSSFGLSDGDYIVSGSTIEVTCAAISVSILQKIEFDNLRDRDISRHPNDLGMLPVNFFHSNSERHIPPRELRLNSARHLTFVENDNTFEDKFVTALNGLYMTHSLVIFMDTSYQFYNVSKAGSNGNNNMGSLSLTERCDKCTILYGLRYSTRIIIGNVTHTVAPVVIKDGDYHRSIGLCAFDRNFTFPDIDTETRHTFVIR